MVNINRKIKILQKSQKTMLEIFKKQKMKNAFQQFMSRYVHYAQNFWASDMSIVTSQTEMKKKKPKKQKKNKKQNLEEKKKTRQQNSSKNCGTI